MNLNLTDYFKTNEALGVALAEAMMRHRVVFNGGVITPEFVYYGPIANLFYSDSPLLSQDDQGKLNFYNLGAQRVFGYSPEEAIGMPSVELVPRALKPGRADKFKHILTERTSVEVQETRLAKDGRLVEIKAFIFPYLLDSKTLIAARVELSSSDKSRLILSRNQPTR